MKSINIVDALDKIGLKKTPGRLAIFQILQQAQHPLTKQEIRSFLSGVKLDDTSIYRTLATFVKAGIVHRVDTGDRNWRFALSSNRDKGCCHPHFICKSCGLVECLQEIELPPCTTSKPGYQIEEQELYLKGLCYKCSC